MKDPDPAVTWADDIGGELPERLWAPGELTVGEEHAEPHLTGNLVSLAFIRAALRRSRWLWCTTAVLGLLIGSGLYLRYPPAYHAQTTVLLADNPNEDPAVQILTDQSLAQSQAVAARVVRELGLQQSVASFQAASTVTVVTDTVLTLNVGAPSSAAAVQRASALATAFLQYRAKYAQTQEEQTVAQLDQQYNAAAQRLHAVDVQLSQMPSTQLTPTQKIQLDKLQTQQSEQKQIMQYVTSTKAAAKTTTEAMVSGSYVLNPATALAHSHLKGAALYVAGGLFGGLAVGMAIVIVGALTSDRLRRRDDIALALGAPVKLSVGPLAGRRWPPDLRGQAALRDRDMRRVVQHLRSVVPGSSQGPASLTVVAVDDVPTVAQAVIALAVSIAKQGRRVVVADLSDGAHAARLLGVENPGIGTVSADGVQLMLVASDPDDVAPIGPLQGRTSSVGYQRSSEALVAACSGAHLVLSLVTLDPAFGSEHLATWAADAVVVVTAGASPATTIHAVGELIRLGGTRLDSAVLIGADKSDDSLGVDNKADQPASL